MVTHRAGSCLLPFLTRVGSQWVWSTENLGLWLVWLLWKWNTFNGEDILYFSGKKLEKWEGIGMTIFVIYPRPEYWPVHLVLFQCESDREQRERRRHTMVDLLGCLLCIQHRRILLWYVPLMVPSLLPLQGKKNYYLFVWKSQLIWIEAGFASPWMKSW